MQFYEITICQVMIYRLYTVYNKHDMIKISNQTREKSQVLSQCSNRFAACCRSNLSDRGMSVSLSHKKDLDSICGTGHFLLCWYLIIQSIEFSGAGKVEEKQFLTSSHGDS